MSSTAGVQGRQKQPLRDQTSSADDAPLLNYDSVFKARAAEFEHKLPALREGALRAGAERTAAIEGQAAAIRLREPKPLGDPARATAQSLTSRQIGEQEAKAAAIAKML